MCWKSDKFVIPRTATENITCYKVFDIRETRWKRKNFLRIPLWKDSITELYSLYRGYLYIPYTPNPEIAISQMCNSQHNYWYINKGYHSYSILGKARLERRSCLKIIIKCIIPIGSTYYLNKNYEIVSSNIIITGEVIE